MNPYNPGRKPGHPQRPKKPYASGPRKPYPQGSGRQPGNPFRPHHAEPSLEPHKEIIIPDDAPICQGVLELHDKGHGYLRDPSRNYNTHPEDPQVSASMIQKFRLREGLLLAGVKEHSRSGHPPRFLRLDTIEGVKPEDFKNRNFDDLTAIDPNEWIRLETGKEPLTTRVTDLLTPIGMGQRGLIVAPPRTGKTVLLQHMAQAVSTNYPSMHLIVLLIDERPEEVTEMRRTIRGEVIASSSDKDSASHVRTAELVVERARRLAEQGKQVFILLDSLTRLARAYNKNVPNSGRIMSGGVDSKALEVPKRLFGTARNFEEGGSLTVMGTALIDTGSRMDEVIFQEFKGTGNMELVLDRKLADRRIFPAMDICQSGTRKEEKLLSPEDLKKTHLLRRMLASMGTVEAMEMLVKKLGAFPSNKAFLDRMNG
ncbi:MAG: transcription termination factor Rho [Gemmataceae bacterium]|nr:transcription termination factor Rho [Gemmataceae bacterium]